MIKHAIDTVGLIFGRIDPIRDIPKQLKDQLYIDHDIDDLDAKTLIVSNVFNTTLVMLYEPISGYEEYSILRTETLPILGSSREHTIYTKPMKYILIPDIIKMGDTDIEVVVNMIHSIFVELFNNIPKTQRVRDSVKSLCVMMTAYVLDYHDVCNSIPDTLSILTGLEMGSDKLMDLVSILDNDDIISLFNSTTDLFKNTGVKIRGNAKCLVEDL